METSWSSCRCSVSAELRKHVNDEMADSRGLDAFKAVFIFSIVNYLFTCNISHAFVPKILWIDTSRQGLWLRKTSNPRLQVKKKRSPQTRNSKNPRQWLYQNLRRHQIETKFPSKDVVECVGKLAWFSNTSQTLEVGRQLERSLEYPIEKPNSKERRAWDYVIQATALAGLHSLAIDTANKSLLCHGLAPSISAQEKICSTLRRTGKVSKMRDFILATSITQTVSTRAFNTYLATLCAQKGPNLTSGRLEAVSLLVDDEERTRFGVNLDEISFATVLNAVCENRTASDIIWLKMEQTGIDIGVDVFNARLKALDQQEALTLWNEAKKVPAFSPDRYSIGLILIPLVRQQQYDELNLLLAKVVKEHEKHVASDAFVAYLDILVSNSETNAAESIFHVFIDPLNKQEQGLVAAKAAHFNLILRAYRDEIRSRRGKYDAADKQAFADKAKELFGRMRESSMNGSIDSYTVVTMLDVYETSDEISTLLLQMPVALRVEGAVLRAAMITYGRVGDCSSACWLLMRFDRSISLPSINAMLQAMSVSIRNGHHGSIDLSSSNASRLIGGELLQLDIPFFVNESIELVDLSQKVLDCLIKFDTLPMPDSQTFCAVASIQQYTECDQTTGYSLLERAVQVGVKADGRFLNALFRCFGEDADSAVNAWQTTVRSLCIKDNKRVDLLQRNLDSAYRGLLHVSGRAKRPDLALKIVYAMKKEGLKPSEMSMNCYLAGKRMRRQLTNRGIATRIAEKIKVETYESLLFVECTEYNVKDKRRQGEARVRIIL